jgi:hypothetical protein
MPRPMDSPHVPVDALLDASRALAPSGAATAAQAHLSACGSCDRKARVWKRFAALAGREAALEPPVEAVERAKALVSAGVVVTRRTSVEAALVHDVAWSPLPAGIRGQSVPEQVVYQAQDLAVELRVSHEPPHRVVIVGHITDTGQPALRLANVRVTLMEGDRVAARALSNSWGEFHVEHDDRDLMRLELAMQEGRTIRIPLRPRRM